MEKQESNLYDELITVEHDILDCVENLINVKWDSNTMKLEIQELVKQRDTLQKELFELDDKKD